VRDQPWARELPRIYRSFALADLRPSLRANAIDGTVVVETVDSRQETVELLELAAAEPEVLGVVGWVDLRAEDVAEDLARLRAGSGGGALVGIRHQVQGEQDPDWLARPDVRRGLDAVGAAGLVYDFVVTAPQLAAVIAAVRRHPEVTFVLDHGGKPPIASGALEPWRSRIAELAELPNVAVKLSGLHTEAAPDARSVERLAPWAAVMLDAFGPERVLFGSDWPVSTLAGGYGEIVADTAALVASLSPGERAAVFGGNAVHWYHLEIA
jgi:L-fucono-1,5-lactonase